MKLGSYWGNTPEVEIHEIKGRLGSRGRHCIQQKRRTGKQRRGEGGREGGTERRGEAGKTETPRFGKNCLERILSSGFCKIITFTFISIFNFHICLTLLYVKICLYSSFLFPQDESLAWYSILILSVHILVHILKYVLCINIYEAFVELLWMFSNLYKYHILNIHLLVACFITDGGFDSFLC